MLANLLGERTVEEEVFFGHGCPMLTLTVSVPQGTSPAALHAAALAEKGKAYAKHVLLKEAEREMDRAFCALPVADFLPRRFLLDFEEKAAVGGVSIILKATLFAGKEPLQQWELPMFWEKNGLFQKRGPHRLSGGFFKKLQQKNGK